MTRTACAVPRCPYPAIHRGRCAAHRQGTSERGYGSSHQKARANLAMTLPAPCGYCGVVIDRAERWVAAHRIDGAPQAGYVVAHPDCNERAKGRPLGSLQAGGPPLTRAPFREKHF